MAKARNFFGLRTGSTKTKTYSILNGWQIEKDRVYGGKNPRTNAQMRQRMVMATASAAYSGMREICDHSFQGTTYGQPTMSKFISENSKLLLQALISQNATWAFNPYQDRNIYRNPYLVSKGTIQNNSTVAIDEINDGTVFIDWTFPAITAQTIFSDFLQNVGIGQNGYITFLAIVNDPVDNISKFGWVRLTPKKEEIYDVMERYNINELFDIESNVEFEGDQSFVVGNRISIPMTFDAVTYFCGCCGIILSDKKLGWQRSTCRMVVHFPNNPTYNPSPAEQALATYPVGTDYVLNGGSIY